MSLIRKSPFPWLERWVTSAAKDEETARIGTRFNELMVLYMFLIGSAVALSLVFPVVPQLLGREENFAAWLIVLIAFGLIAWLSLLMSKYGAVQPAIYFFVWADFLGVMIANAVYGGSQAMGNFFFFYFWPVAIAGMLLPPSSVIWLIGVGLLYFVLLFWGEHQYWYRPPLTFSSRAMQVFVFVDGVVTWVTVGGLLNFINIHRLRNTVNRLSQSTTQLEDLRSDLEQRVVERTQALAMRAERFKIIAELSHTATAILDLQPLLDETVTLISDRLGYYHAGIFLIDETRQWAVLEAASSTGGQKMLQRGHRLRVGEQGIVGYVAKTGQSRIALDVGEDVTWFNNPDLPNTHSELALPLIVGGEVLGVLDIQTERSQAFTEDDIEVLRTLADNIAVAIDNAKHTEEMKETLERLSRYREQNAIHAWRSALSRRRMQLNYAYSMGTVLTHEGRLVDELPDLSQVTVQSLPEGGQRLWLPVYVQGLRIGEIFFDRSNRWLDDEIQLAQYVAAQLEMALENARLLEETRLRAYQERARSEIVAQVRSSGTVNAILRSVAEGLGRALGVERSRIQLAQYDD